MTKARILADYVSSDDELALKAPLASPTFTGTTTLQGLTTIKPSVAGDATVFTIDGDTAGNVGNFGIKRNGATLGLIETAYSDINITCQASGADLKLNFGNYNNTAIKVKQSNGYVGIGQQGTFDDAATTPDYPLHITCETIIGGNVGINDTSPGVKLAVESGASQSSGLGDTAGAFQVGYIAAAGGRLIMGGNNDGHSFIQGSNGSSAYPVCLQLSGGNVGIGTAPSTLLHLKPPSGAAELTVEAPATNQMSRLTLSTPASSAGGSGAELVFKEGSGGGGANNSKFWFHHSPNSGIFQFYADSSLVWSVPEGATTVTFPGDIVCNNLSTADLIMSNQNPNRDGNEIDGTKGSWAMQEGDENMYLINRNNGKRFKIMLEEV